MSEYETYWLTDFLLINNWEHNYGDPFLLLKWYALLTINKQTNKYNKKLILLQSIGISYMYVGIKVKLVTYTCRYSSRHLIPIIQPSQSKLGIKCPLEYLQVWATTLVSLLV